MRETRFGRPEPKISSGSKILLPCAATSSSNSLAFAAVIMFRREDEFLGQVMLIKAPFRDTHFKLIASLERQANHVLVHELRKDARVIFRGRGGARIYVIPNRWHTLKEGLEVWTLVDLYVEVL